MHNRFKTVESAIKCNSNECLLIKVNVIFVSFDVKAKCSVLEGQALDHGLMLG